MCSGFVCVWVRNGLRTTPMARVTLCLLFLPLVLTLQQSDAVSGQCNKLEEENDRLEKEITRITAQKHQYEQFYGQCKENLTQQSHTLQTNSRKLTETGEVISYLKTTIDCLTNTVQSFNQTENGLREKKQQLQETIDGLTKTEEANNRTVQDLLEKQKQMQTTIDDLAKTVEAMNHKFKMMCGQTKTACRDLIQAVKSGDVNTVRILASCTDDNCTADDSKQNKPITLAADNGNLEVVRVLLEGGANVETTNNWQFTALHEAAYDGNLNMSRLLLDWGAKLDSLSKWKRTPLHYAARDGYLTLVQLLLLKGANVSLKDEEGKTAREWARQNGKNAVVDWLDSVGRV